MLQLLIIKKTKFNALFVSYWPLFSNSRQCIELRSEQEQYLVNKLYSHYSFKV